MFRLKKYQVLLSCFSSLPKEIQKTIIKNSDDKLTRLVCEICLNLEKNNIPVTGKKSKKVKQQFNIIRAFASKKKTLFKKKKYLRQKGGFILPLLASVVAPFLSKIVGKVLN